MSDLGTQLRDYFDAVVERATVEDVLARSAFVPDGRSRLQRPGRPALQAALAAGYGFGLTMLVTGALLVVAMVAGDLVQGELPMDVGGGAPAAGPVGAGWFVAAGLIAVGSITALSVAVRRRDPTVITKEEDMKTIEPEQIDAEVDSRVHSLERRNRWLVATVVVLLVVAAALGGILLFADGEAANAPDVDGAALDEINALIDANLQGWSDGDGDAVMATMAADGFHISEGSAGLAISGDRLRDFSSSFVSAEWERLGTPVVQADATGYYVAELTRVFAEDSASEESASWLIVTRIRPEGGELRIAEQVVYEDIAWSMYGPNR